MAAYQKKAVTIRQDQAEWLATHTEINFSGLIQKKLDDLMELDNIT